MKNTKRMRSIRRVMITAVGISLLAFLLCFFIVVDLNMVNILSDSEEKYLETVHAVVEGNLQTMNENLLLQTKDIAHWDETIEYVRGNNPDYLQSNWPGSDMPTNYKIDLVIIKDFEGNDVYTDCFDRDLNISSKLPDGFTESLRWLSIDVVDRYVALNPSDTADQGIGRIGTVFFGDSAYYICTMPLSIVGETDVPVGTITFGNRLTNNFFQKYTHFFDTAFVVTKLQNARPLSAETDGAAFLTSLQLPCLEQGNDQAVAMLEMQVERSIYTRGQSIILFANIFLLLIVAVFIITLYLLITRFFIKPIERLSADIGGVSSHGALDTENYVNREFFTLCTEINSMIERVAEAEKIRELAADIGKRLEQQELMLSISQSFISTADMSVLICGALQMVGDFLGLHYTRLASFGHNGEACKIEFEWTRCNGASRANGSVQPASSSGCKIYKVLVDERAPYITQNEVDGKGELPDCCLRDETASFISVPIIIEGKVWGVLSFFHSERGRIWSESDTQLVRMIASVISGVILRDQTEEMLKRMFSVTESAPFLVAYVLPDGRFEYVNPSAEIITGYSAAELHEGHMRMLLPADVLDRFRSELLPTLTEKGKGMIEIPITRKNGEECILSVSAFLAGSSSGIGVIAYDITEKRQLETELITAKEQAEEASHAKGSFLSRMSHEIRTPINAIIGMTSIAKSSNELERKEYCLNKISEASKQLLAIINDVLDMSKIEANKFELDICEFDFGKMVRSVVDVINYQVEEKKQRFLANIDRRIPRFVIADDKHLAQVITNLLSNAVKFTPEEGTITLDARLVSKRDRLYKIRMSVSDTGIGIDEEQKRRLFTSFEQADGGIARKYGGTGLGLAISKSIINMMGGDIWIDSQPGKGSTFTFEIEVEKGASENEVSFSLDVPRESLHILAIDDDPIVREYFKSLMDSLGIYCETVGSGQEALDLLSRTDDFNIIFVDWKMPGMDGVELARRMKESGINNSNTTVIMISAAGWGEIEADARAAEIKHFIPKPLTASVLVDCINDCLGVNRNAGEANKAGDCNYTGKHLLLVEDIEVNREIIFALLEGSGIEITGAENGLIALNLMRENPDDYDIIFMDIHMPEMDGFEATEGIRALDNAKAKEIPIIAMTASVFREDIEKCLNSGMNDHVGKPVDREDMILKLEKHLNKKAVESASRPRSTGSSAQSAGSEPVDYTIFLPEIDVKGGLDRFAGKLTLYISLLKSFDCNALVGNLSQAMREKDAAKTSQSAHALRGAAANIGLKKLMEVSAVIENHARSRLVVDYMIDELNKTAEDTLRQMQKLLAMEERLT